MPVALPDARPPLVAGPVSLMRLVEIREVEVALDHMGRLGYGPEDLAVEVKFNGWLVQCAGGRLFTRRGKEDITEKFPEIAAAVSPYESDHLVGELVYVTPKGRMDEPTVTTIAGTDDPDEVEAKRAALPGRFEYVLFDALALEGLEVSGLPTLGRLEALRERVAPAGPLRISSVHPFEAWQGVYEQSLAVGGDGVVLKNVHAPYVWRPLGETEARPVGHWYKLKPVLSDDFVVYDLSRGPKGRLLLVFGQFHGGRLVPVGQVNNLARPVEREAQERMKAGPFVAELKFQARFPDPPGALQHPRFVRFRDDKEAGEAVLPEIYAP